MKTSLIVETFREEMNKLKSSGDFEDLLDLESARKANEASECNDCFSCDCYDPDLVCTMPSIHKDYACSLYNNGEPQFTFFD